VSLSKMKERKKKKERMKERGRKEEWMEGRK
jgi:hypothetical protein